MKAITDVAVKVTTVVAIQVEVTTQAAARRTVKTGKTTPGKGATEETRRSLMKAGLEVVTKAATKAASITETSVAAIEMHAEDLEAEECGLQLRVGVALVLPPMSCNLNKV